MIGWPYAYPTIHHARGTLGLLIFLSAIVLVITDHALEATLERQNA